MADLTKIALPWIDDEEVARRHEVLFHYTNFLNLRSILQTGGLFCSHYTNTNDRSELQTAKEILRPGIADGLYSALLEIKSELLEEISADGIDPKDLCNKEPDNIYRSALKTHPHPPHLTCFSYHETEIQKQNGLLSMWRSYCAGEGGIALGFSAAAMVKRSKELREQCVVNYMYLERVCYGSNDDELIKRLGECDEIYALAPELIIAAREGREPTFDINALLKLIVLACSVKHEDFTDEREIRFIACANDSPSDEEHRIDVIGNRFILPMADCMQSILIGPSRDQTAIKSAVEFILKDLGVSKIEIACSETPFRGR